MRNFNICLMVVLLVGCGTVPSTDVDSGVLPDASTTDVVEMSDAGTDTSANADAGTDAGEVPDAGTPDSGADAGTGSDSGTPDVGTDAGTVEVPDAGTDTGSMTDGGVGDVVGLGVSGDGSCLLTDDNEMWCWGYGNTTPVFVADAVELNGTCGVALDGHAFCWTSSGIRSYPSTDVAVLGVRTYASRPAGEVVDFGHLIAPWAPPVPVAAMPAADCAIDINGGLTCWDTVDIDPSPLLTTLGFANFYDVVPSGATYDATDAARRGGIATEDLVVCYVTTEPTIRCWHTRGRADPSIYLAIGGPGGMYINPFEGGSEVEMANGRACAVVPDASYRPAGVYCTADRPAAFGSSGHWPLNPLPAGDAYLNPYTDIVGTDLAVGANHTCVMQGSSIMCWGDNRRGQLGDGTTTSSRAPQSIVW